MDNPNVSAMLNHTMNLRRSRVSRLLASVVLGFVTGVAGAALPEPPKQMQVRVIGITDGDTIVVADTQRRKYTVQMDGIDAPELAQPYGAASKLHLERRILNRTVILMWHKTGKDGTLIAKVMFNNGDINMLQLRTGSAWNAGNLTVNYSGNDKARYASSQKHAQDKQLGLWREGNAVEPWEWRKQNAPAPN
jgi:endonuclease YncB( thermonuclease family)